MDNLSEILIEESLRETIKHYGLEGTEDCIKRVYKNNSKAREVLLNAFYKRFKK